MIDNLSIGKILKLLIKKLNWKVMAIIKEYIIKHKKLLSFIYKIRRTLFRYLFYFKYKFKVKQYLKASKIRKLQIGTGQNPLNGWLNTDYDTGLSKGSVFLDATNPLPFPPQTFDYIYFEHFIEHIEYYEGQNLLDECHRILKSEGKIRFSTPDLNFLIDLYKEKKTDIEKDYIKWLISTQTKFNVFSDTFLINTYFHEWGHKFIYDFKTLKALLTQTGFTNIKKVSVGESDDENLQNLESHGSIVGDVFNRLESLVIEATKK